MTGRPTAADTQPAAAVPPASVRRSPNPSRWSRRLLVAGLALLGCLVASYLTLYQVHALHSVWDPLFGGGSERVLTSSLSRALPVPDAALGGLAYLTEAVLELSGRRDRWYSQPWFVFATGLVAAGLGLTAVVLVISQPLLAGTFCTLCLVSAALSLTIAALVVAEVRAAVAGYASPAAGSAECGSGSSGRAK
jgi:uncharacterized membrane protein